METAQILVVEDNTIVVEALQSMLQRLGYTVAATANCGSEAIEAAAETHPDLVLMDIELGESMDGIDIAKAILAQADVPIVFLTAHADEATIQRTKAANPYGYVVKPCEARELHSAIEIALSKHQAERAIRQMHKELERRIEERTAELEATNQRLQREIEERRQVEEALRTSTAKVRAMFESIPDGIVFTDLQGKILDVNEATVRRQRCMSKEDLIGRDGFEFALDGCREEARKHLQDILVSGHTGSVEYQMLTQDGRTLDVDVRAALIKDTLGNPTGIVAITRDITTRKQVEGELERYRHHLEDLVEARTTRLLKLNDDLEKEISERKQVEGALQHRIEQLTSLSRASQVITASLDPDRVMNQIVSLAAQVAVSDYASLVLADSGARWEWSATSLADIPAIQRCLGQNGYTRWVSSSRQSILVSDVDEDGTAHPTPPDGAPASIDDPLRQVSIRSLVALPLIVQDRLLGVLCLQSTRSHVFDDQLASLTIFANQVAVAIENARLHQRTLRQVEELVALNRVSRALTSSPNLEEILETIVKEIALALKTEAGSASLLLLDSTSDELIFRAAAGPLADQVKGQRFPAKLGIAGQVAREGQPLIVPDVGQDKHFYPGIDEATGFATKSLLAVPLKIRENVIGVIEVVNKIDGEFTQQDVDLLSSIAHATAIAIENIRLMEEAAEAQVLRELDRLRSELVSNVSHELRTPLGLIKVFSTTLLSEDVQFDREVELECLHSIEEEADRLEQIVDNLLDLSRIQGEYLQLDKQPTDVGQLARSVAKAMAVHLARHNLVFNLPKRPLTAMVDAKRMEQVLRNLLSNACKYSPAGGTITIHGSRNRHQVLVGVGDEGIGIPQEHLESIFERFFRVDNEVTRQVSGAGLGLAVCQGIVKAHGGRIWAESTLGEGSTFYFSLPSEQTVRK